MFRVCGNVHALAIVEGSFTTGAMVPARGLAAEITVAVSDRRQPWNRVLPLTLIPCKSTHMTLFNSALLSTFN